MKAQFQDEKLKAFPGPLSQGMLQELGQYVLASPYPFVVDLEKCEGMYLATIDGQRLFDWSGYYASKLISHNHPGLQEPDYLKKLVLAANNKVANPDFLTPECLDYYRLVHSLAPHCMRNTRLEVYCVNSGAEAIENMLKYFINLHKQKHPDRSKSPEKFIYFDQAFHGRTVFALNVTQLDHDPLITRDFHGFSQGNLMMPFPAMDLDMPSDEHHAKARATIDMIEMVLKHQADDIAGIILEPIQGAGGHRVAPMEFYQRLSQLAHQYDISLGFDEVQTAGGQAGSFFAVDMLDLPYPPQAVATAKKLGCGVVYMLYPMDDHGVLDSTWGGHLADMVRFVQEMKIVQRERLLEQVPEKSKHLQKRLHQLTVKFPLYMGNVRGLGLYQGFSLRKPEWKQQVVRKALEDEQMLLLGAGAETIRLRPTLSVTIEDIDLFAQKLERLLEGLE